MQEKNIYRIIILKVLWALNQSGILDIILYMSSENEKQYFMHILEIISHLLREQNPSSLADAALQRSVDEKLRDEQELLSIRMSENKHRINKIKQYSASRLVLRHTYYMFIIYLISLQK